MLHRRLLALGRPFDLVQHKYLIGLYADTHPYIIICKAGQTGISEYSISWMLYSADERKATGLYVFPTDNAVSDFAAARLGPAIELGVSPYLSSLVVAGTTGTRRGADKVGLKRVGDRFVYFRGARVQKDGKAPQLRSIDADVLVLDEYDEMDVRAPSIARERLGHSRIHEWRELSTPTYAETGIHARYLESDQCTWMVRCKSCTRYQDLTLDDIVLEFDDFMRPVAWNQNDDGEAFVACRKCGGEMDRGGDGEWVPAAPESSLRGYHISRLFVPFRSINDIIKGLQSLDEMQRQQTWNQGLGLPYVSSSSARITDAHLNAIRREYGLKVTEGTAVMGMDVGSALHIIIREKNTETGMWDARFIGTVETFDEAYDLAVQYKVVRCVVDSLPETRAAREFQDKFPKGRVWLAYYDTRRSGEKRKELAKWDATESRVNVDRTRALDGVVSSVTSAITQIEDGITLPADIRNNREYMAHMRSAQRVLQEDQLGQMFATWIHTGDDHYLHCEAYCYVAIQKGIKVAALPEIETLVIHEQLVGGVPPWLEDRDIPHELYSEESVFTT